MGSGEAKALLKYCRPKNGMPLKLTAGGDGLVVDFHDYTMYIQLNIEGSVLEPGSVCVEGELFIKAVNTMAGALTLEAQDDQLVLNGVMRLGVVVDSPPDFPSCGEVLAQLNMSHCLKRTTFATDASEGEMCEVVYLDSDAVVATDKSRIVIYDFDSGLPGVAVPAVLTKPLLTMGEVTISDSEYYLIFAGGGVRIALPKIQVPYPEYRKYVPKLSERTAAKVNRKDFIDLVKRASLAKTENSSVGVCFVRLRGGELEVYARDSLVEYREVIPAEVNGEPTETSLSYTRLMDFLQQADDIVEIYIREMNPVLLACPGYQCVLMPVRT